LYVYADEFILRKKDESKEANDFDNQKGQLQAKIKGRKDLERMRRKKSDSCGISG
jgi:hypothetical protein